MKWREHSFPVKRTYIKSLQWVWEWVDAQTTNHRRAHCHSQQPIRSVTSFIFFLFSFPMSVLQGTRHTAIRPPWDFQYPVAMWYVNGAGYLQRNYKGNFWTIFFWKITKSWWVPLRNCSSLIHVTMWFTGIGCHHLNVVTKCSVWHLGFLKGKVFNKMKVC